MEIYIFDPKYYNWLSPVESLSGRKIRTSSDILYPDVDKEMLNKQEHSFCEKEDKDLQYPGYLCEEF